MGITIIVKKSKGSRRTILDAARQWEAEGQKFTTKQAAFWKHHHERIEHEQEMLRKGKTGVGGDLGLEMAEQELHLEEDGKIRNNAGDVSKAHPRWQPIGDLPDQCVGVKETDEVNNQKKSGA